MVLRLGPPFWAWFLGQTPSRPHFRSPNLVLSSLRSYWKTLEFWSLHFGNTPKNWARLEALFEGGSKTRVFGRGFPSIISGYSQKSSILMGYRKIIEFLSLHSGNIPKKWPPWRVLFGVVAESSSFLRIDKSIFVKCSKFWVYTSKNDPPFWQLLGVFGKVSNFEVSIKLWFQKWPSILTIFEDILKMIEIMVL